MSEAQDGAARSASAGTQELNSPMTCSNPRPYKLPSFYHTFFPPPHFHFHPFFSPALPGSCLPSPTLFLPSVGYASVSGLPGAGCQPSVGRPSLSAPYSQCRDLAKLGAHRPLFD